MPYPSNWWEYHHKIGNKDYLYPNDEFRKIFKGFKEQRFSLLRADYTDDNGLESSDFTIECDEKKYFYHFSGKESDLPNETLHNLSKFYHKWTKIVREDKIDKLNDKGSKD